MNSRERVITALNRRQPDRVPFEISYGAFTPGLMNVFKAKTGSDNPADYFDFDVREVKISDTKKKIDFSNYLTDMPDNAILTEWGKASVPGSIEHFRHYKYHALENCTSVGEIKQYPWPDIDADYRYDEVKKNTEAYHKRGYAVIGQMYTTIFETAYGIRGMENLLTDFYLNQDILKEIFDNITELRIEQAKQFARADVDVLGLGDDLGTQRGLMISRDMYKQWIKPRHKIIIDAAKSIKPDILIFYHCDGAVKELIPDFIDIGINALNPVQPECMDPYEIKKAYGDKLAFWGTVGTQTTMPFGTPEDVKSVVKGRIETVGIGGGLLLAPTHILEPEVPWENIVAFIEAVKEYGIYPTA
ncbi:MAG: uroporphyrinogen decarboxylase family protein [Desulfitobacteriaceae bacterium]